MNTAHLRRHTCALLWAAAVHVPCCMAQASDCPDPLFMCESNRNGKFIAICATEIEPGRKWKDLQYRYGVQGGSPDLLFPPDPSSGQTALRFSHVKRGADYRVSIRFSNKGYVYQVFSTTGPDGAGVSVSDPKGKLVSVARCIERPQIFPSYLQRALACDMANPHGTAACADKPYEERP